MHHREPYDDVKTLEEQNSKGSIKIEVYGKAMIERKVGSSGKTGRIYVPPGWVGHEVRVIRVD